IITPTLWDNCTPVNAITWEITDVTSNEPENSTGDGNTEDDWLFNGHNLQLRAERKGNGDGRIYYVTITANDGNGNVNSYTEKVYVAHNIHAPFNGNTVKVGTVVNFGGTFWDVAGIKHTAKW